MIGDFPPADVTGINDVTATPTSIAFEVIAVAADTGA